MTLSHISSAKSGNLKPAYAILKDIIPTHPACKTLKGLAHEVASYLGKEYISDSNLRRNLGFTTTQGISEGYLGAFKHAFGLNILGIDDSLLFESDTHKLKFALQAAFQARAFEWLFELGKRQQQQNEGLPLQNADVPPRIPAGVYLRQDHGEVFRGGEKVQKNSLEEALGPNSNVALPIDQKDNIPVAQTGYSYKFHIALEEPGGFVTILSQDPIKEKLNGQDYFPTYCLDQIVGCMNKKFEAGEQPLPGNFEMNPPEGVTRTLMIVTQKPLNAIEMTSEFRQLHPTQTNSILCAVLRDDTARIYTDEYIVTDNTIT